MRQFTVVYYTKHNFNTVFDTYDTLFDAEEAAEELRRNLWRDGMEDIDVWVESN